jgi:hypothetical protein
MTDDEWLEVQDLTIAREGLQLAKERALERARMQLYVTQRELRELLKLREAIEHNRRKEELWADILAAMEEEYEFSRRYVAAALEGGARVERGKLGAEVMGMRPRRGWRRSWGWFSRCITR